MTGDDDLGVEEEAKTKGANFISKINISVYY